MADHAARIMQSLPGRIHDTYRLWLETAANRVALIDDKTSWTYRELDSAVGNIADRLRSLGIRPGDRLIIASENSIELAGLLLAASTLDAWAIVTNPRLSAREIGQIREHSGARRLFFTVGVSKEAAAHAEQLGVVIQDIGPLKDIGVTDLNSNTDPEPVEVERARQVAVLIYTSGTTGTPKGVMLTHENLMFAARTSVELRKMTVDDKLYCVLPISHIVGISLLIASLMGGGAIRLVSKYDPAALVEAMARENITLLNGVPATYQRLLEYKKQAGLAKLDRGSLRMIGVAGAPLDLELKTRVQEELGLSLLNGYGITECSPGISGVRFEQPRNDESVGFLLPGLEARLVGVDGQTVQAGQVGELHVRGKNVMRGYYRDPGLTAKAIDPEGWFNTGDLARFDGDALFIVGRTKEMIIRSGFNVYPAEIEAVLSAHPDVVQCAVVGRPVQGNEEIVAFVQLFKGSSTDAADLIRFVGGQLTAYKRPSEIILLDSLPATSTGKILKHRLAESARALGDQSAKAS